MPSTTSTERSRPGSSTVTTRTPCAAWWNDEPPSDASARSPACPKAGWPTSCARAMASTKSSRTWRPLPSSRAMATTSSVWVRRVRTSGSPGAATTCVLPARRRKARDRRMRPRSRANDAAGSAGARGAKERTDGSRAQAAAPLNMCSLYRRTANATRERRSRWDVARPSRPRGHGALARAQSLDLPPPPEGLLAFAGLAGVVAAEDVSAFAGLAASVEVLSELDEPAAGFLVEL